MPFLTRLAVRRRPAGRRFLPRPQGGTFALWALLFVLAFFQCVITRYLRENPDYYQIGPYAWESAGFRAMKLGEGAAALEELDPARIAGLMAEESYDLTGRTREEILNMDSAFRQIRPRDFEKLAEAYGRVFGDLEYFPVPASLNPDTPDVTYQDGWMDGREYVSGDSAGKPDESVQTENGVQEGDTEAGAGQEASRSHEGCDVMAGGQPRGFYPVVSMSDGVVEKMGWLELGGWRLGIRTPKGAYLYYAHLYRYAEELKEGDQVRAGQLLGFMGDSGYGPEGTVGQFPVHLHVGIYIGTEHYEEMSVNPYWLLRFLEKRRVVYNY